MKHARGVDTKNNYVSQVDDSLIVNELPAFHTDVRGVSLVFLNLIYVSQVDDLLTVNELPAFHIDVRGVSLVSLIPFSDCASQPIDLFAVCMSQPCGDLSKKSVCHVLRISVRITLSPSNISGGCMHQARHNVSIPIMAQ